MPELNLTRCWHSRGAGAGLDGFVSVELERSPRELIVLCCWNKGGLWCSSEGGA